MTWAIDRNQQLGEKMLELIDESLTPDIEPVSTLLERISEPSLAEMDKAIQELKRARNILRNERERVRLEIAGLLRLTQAAMGSANAASANISNLADDIPAGDFVSAPGRREAA